MYARHLAIASVVLVSIGISACDRTDMSTSRPEVTVLDFRMPASNFAGIEAIEDKSVVVDDFPSVSEKLPLGIRAMRNKGIRSSAYYKYKVRVDGQQSTIKVKLNTLSSVEAAKAEWLNRHLKEDVAAASPFPYGDQAFDFGGWFIAVQKGPYLLEFLAPEKPPFMRDFVDTYLRFADSVMSRD